MMAGITFVRIETAPKSAQAMRMRRWACAGSKTGGSNRSSKPSSSMIALGRRAMAPGVGMRPLRLRTKSGSPKVSRRCVSMRQADDRLRLSFWALTVRD